MMKKIKQAAAASEEAGADASAASEEAGAEAAGEVVSAAGLSPPQAARERAIRPARRVIPIVFVSLFILF